MTAGELGRDFDIAHALRYGMLPSVWVDDDPADYVASYVSTYLEEEVRQEGLTRNLGAFSRFVTSASFSQGQVLNVTEVARESAINRKVAEDYFDILEDLLISVRIPVFTRRAKRKLVAHPKFYFFDAGVYGAIRPRGPLDSAARIEDAHRDSMSAIAGTDAFYTNQVDSHDVRRFLRDDDGPRTIGLGLARPSPNAIRLSSLLGVIAHLCLCGVFTERG